jgi:hypothetical protein
LVKYYPDGARKTEINGLGGSIVLESTFVKVEIGQLIIRQTALVSKEFHALFSTILRSESYLIGGILGSDILAKYRITINYDNKTITYRLREMEKMIVQASE